MIRTRVTGLVLAALAMGTIAVAQQRPATPPGGAITPDGEQSDTAPIMYREVFTYDAEGRRDPFAPLLETSELRPTLQELRLTGVLVHPTRPIAVMRDGEGTQYRVTTGMSVGRMRVIEIKPKTVVFAFSEYGHDRRDSLVLGDTAQVRP